MAVDASEHDRTRLTLTVEEAAHLIGISRAQAYRCVKRGELKAVQLGRRWVVPVAAIEHLLGTAVTGERPDDTTASSPPEIPAPSRGRTRT